MHPLRMIRTTRESGGNGEGKEGGGGGRSGRQREVRVTDAGEGDGMRMQCNIDGRGEGGVSERRRV